MSNKNTLELTKIEGLGLNSTNYGENLNVRLNNIEDNFKKITQFDYIKGAPGDSYGSRTIKLNEGDDLTKKIATIIADNNTAIIDYVVNNIKGRELVEFYKIVNDKKTVTSILPFVYQDPACAELVSIPDNKIAEFKDKSCVILYNPENENGFFKTQTNPTIYYNTGEGAFCWKIGETETNLICQGPKGNDGKNGSLYIAKVVDVEDKENTSILENTCKIVSILYNTTDGIKEISPEKFKNYFGFEGGESILCIYEKTIEATDENREVVKYTDIETFISPIQIISEKEYHVSKKYGCFHFDKIENLVSLETLLNNIDNNSYLRGLFIPVSPAESSTESSTESSKRAHMIWDSTVDSTVPTANIGVVNNVHNPAPPNDSEGIEGIFNVHYKTINFKDISVDNLKIRGTELGQRFSEFLPLKSEIDEGKISHSVSCVINSNDVDGNIVPYNYIINNDNIIDNDHITPSLPLIPSKDEGYKDDAQSTASIEIPNVMNGQYKEFSNRLTFDFEGQIHIKNEQGEELDFTELAKNGEFSMGAKYYAFLSKYDTDEKLEKELGYPYELFNSLDGKGELDQKGNFKFAIEVPVIGSQDTHDELTTELENRIDQVIKLLDGKISVKYCFQTTYKYTDKSGAEQIVSYPQYPQNIDVKVDNIPITIGFKSSDSDKFNIQLKSDEYKSITVDGSHTTYMQEIVIDEQSLDVFSLEFENYKSVGKDNPIWNKNIEIYNLTDKDLKLEIWDRDIQPEPKKLTIQRYDNPLIAGYIEIPARSTTYLKIFDMKVPNNLSENPSEYDYERIVISSSQSITDGSTRSAQIFQLV